MKLEHQWSAHNYHPLPVVIAKGEGCWVEDVEGKRYLDLLGGYSAMSFGHGHPELVETALKQLQTLTLTSRAFYNDQLPELARSLAKLCDQDTVLPMNTGAEAVETALKAARKWGYEIKGVKRDKARVIVFEGNFHGRTTTIVGFSTSPSTRDGFGPYVDAFDIVEFGNLDAVRNAITDETVAVLVEPIQGEGGVNVPPKGFLSGLRALCDDQNVLLLCDEIQTGLGRTGRILDAHHENVRADISIVGKALGGGLVPLSAAVGKKEVMAVFTPGTHGSTFGGNPLASAIGSKAVEILERGELVDNAVRCGAYFHEGLCSIDSPLIKEVRGRGLLRAIELTPDAGGGRSFAEALLAEGVLTKHAHETVLRFAPPLTIGTDDIDFAIDKIQKVFRKMTTRD